MDRLIIIVVISGALALVWLGWQLVKARLTQSIDASGEAGGKPTLLYFTGEYCTVCKFQQSPIVESLAAKFSDAVAIKQVDVSTEPELASKYKVLTLPTTVVVNPQGQVAHINYGLADLTRLETQLTAI
jgi:thioredoxin 1